MKRSNWHTWIFRSLLLQGRRDTGYPRAIFCFCLHNNICLLTGLVKVVQYFIIQQLQGTSTGYACRLLLHATMSHSVTSLTIITIAWKLHFISETLCIVQIVTVIWLTWTRLLLFSAYYIERQLLVFVTHVGRLFIHKIRIVICYTFKRLCYIVA